MTPRPMYTDCPSCGGTGVGGARGTEPCATCSATGRTARPATLAARFAVNYDGNPAVFALTNYRRAR